MTGLRVALVAFAALLPTAVPACGEVGHDEAGRSAPPPDAAAGPEDAAADRHLLVDASGDVKDVGPEEIGTAPIDDCADAGDPKKPLVVASGPFNPGGLAVDETHAYWISIGPPACVKCALTKDGAILKAPRCGGAPVQLASDLWNVWALTLDDAFVYWLDLTDPNPVMLPRVAKVPKVGGAVSTLAVHPSDGQLGGIAVDSTSVYWTLRLDSAPTLRLRKAAKSGGVATDLGQVDGHFPGEVLLDPTTAYWNGSVEIYSVPLAGGPMETLLPKEEWKAPYWMAIDTTHIYWNHAKELFHMPLAGGTPVLLSKAPAWPLGGLSLDETHLYWGDGGLSGIVKMPKAGGAFVKLVEDPKAPSHARIQGARVYWTSGGASDGKILSVPK